MGKNSRERTGKDIEFRAAPRCEDDVILRMLDPAALLEADRQRTFMVWLCDKMTGHLPYFGGEVRLVFRQTAFPGPTGILPGNRSNPVRTEVFQHHLPLVDISQPIGRDRWQHGRLAEIKSDNLRCECQQ